MSVVASKMPSEVEAVVGYIEPDAHTADTYTTDWVSAGDFYAYQAKVLAGELGTSATIDAKIEQDIDGTGSAAKDVTNAAITQMTQASDDDSDKVRKIEFRQQDLDVEGGFDFVRLSVTVGTATSDMGALLLGIGPRHAPASDSEADDVDETVTVTNA